MEAEGRIMRRSGVHSRRGWLARLLVMAAFSVAALVADLAALDARPVRAESALVSPGVFLPVVASWATGAGTALPTPTSIPTPDPTAEPGAYDQVHLAWTGPSATTFTVVWRTKDMTTASSVQFRQTGLPLWRIASGVLRPSGTTGALHEVTVGTLKPDTSYEYRVQADGGAWSATFTTRTAPPQGPASFDAVFFADTGLVGRTDGLASGTQQVIDEIGKMKPLVLLAGGDYAYFDTDKRYGTYENAIDAWFNQVQPIASQSPLMPTYGNHEFELDGGTKPWAQRLPMLPGDDSRRYYSFDVGDVHFISLFAASDKTGVDAAQLAWLEQDLNDAEARGMRWMIPYFHVVMFGDGMNHGSNLLVREDLGPVFERHGVKLVFYAHDQAYERSYPLVDVPNSNRPTSNSLTCYTPDDGVVYVKVSPSGKESNISGAFSPFKSAVKPAWTAVRDNSMHHLARLRVSEGSITVEAWGIKGDGSTPVLLDQFRVTAGKCS